MPELKRDDSTETVPYIGEDTNGDGEVDKIPSKLYAKDENGDLIEVQYPIPMKQTIGEDTNGDGEVDKIPSKLYAKDENGDLIEVQYPIPMKQTGSIVTDEIISNLIRLAPSSPPSDFTEAPGGKVLLAGDSSAGFYGFVQPNDFGEIEDNPDGSKDFSGDNLALALGISQGTSQYSDIPWMKFSWNGKILFVPVRTIRYGISWNAIYNAGAVYGDDSVGTLPPSGRVGTELSVQASDNSINIDTATDDGFLRSSAVLGSAGDAIVLAGFGDNDGEHEIDSITDEKIIVTSASTLVDFAGTNDSRIWNKADEVTQDAIGTIGGLQYRVRLMRGAANDPVDSYADVDKGSLGDENEWNGLMLPLHERAKDGSWNYTDYAPASVDDWAVGLTDENIITHNEFGSGSYSWCQEARNDSATYRRVCRGNNGVSYLYANSSWITYSYYGWRPVLELL